MLLYRINLYICVVKAIDLGGKDTNNTDNLQLSLILLQKKEGRTMT